MNITLPIGGHVEFSRCRTKVTDSRRDNPRFYNITPSKDMYEITPKLIKVINTIIDTTWNYV
ncbi:MAG: hypothetical protein V8T82_11105 [Romboutsia timonensis]